MQTALKIVAMGFIGAGVVWFVTVHTATIMDSLREGRKRRRKS
jgi:hypothetical protein